MNLKISQHKLQIQEPTRIKYIFFLVKKIIKQISTRDPTESTKFKIIKYHFKESDYSLLSKGCNILQNVYLIYLLFNLCNYYYYYFFFFNNYRKYIFTYLYNTNQNSKIKFLIIRSLLRILT